jgi:hypothetical protein
MQSVLVACKVARNIVFIEIKTGGGAYFFAKYIKKTTIGIRPFSPSLSTVEILFNKKGDFLVYFCRRASLICSDCCLGENLVTLHWLYLAVYACSIYMYVLHTIACRHYGINPSIAVPD